jgi:hypothetical protein
VPPLASRKRPGRAVRASVKAPRTWPKSSLSSRLCGTAAQLIATKGPLCRALIPWMARATSSLPVPLSPVTSTVASVEATRSMRLRISRIARLDPTSALDGCARTTSLCSRRHLLAQAPVLHRALHGDREHVGVDGLGEEVVGPGAHRPHGGLQVAVPGEHDHRHVGVHRRDVLAERDAVHRAHLHVRQHQRELLARHPGDALLGVLHAHRLVPEAAHEGRDHLAHVRVVVYDQHPRWSIYSFGHAIDPFRESRSTTPTRALRCRGVRSDSSKPGGVTARLRGDTSPIEGANCYPPGLWRVRHTRGVLAGPCGARHDPEARRARWHMG